MFNGLRMRKNHPGLSSNSYSVASVFRNMFLKLENYFLLTLDPATPPKFMCGLGGGNQNSSQTSSLGLWFDNQVWNGITSSWRKNPLDTSEVIATHYALAPYANHEVMNDILIPASDDSWMTHCEDYAGQLSWEATAASNLLSCWGRGGWSTRQEVICKSLHSFMTQSL